MKHLARVRKIAAVIVILLALAIFFDPYEFIPETSRDIFTSMQFVPSLLKFSVSGLELAAAGFILVVILTFFSGRSYCSFICPLGILQDLAGRLKRKRKFAHGNPLNLVRYPLLSLVVLMTVLSGTSALIWLDPYSLFGRFARVIPGRIALAANNSLAEVAMSMDIYSVHAVERAEVSWAVLFMALVPVLAILILSYFRGRLYCNSICPVGAFLGIIGKFSLFKIELNNSTCISCGKCESVCKSSCIEYSAGTVDFTRCVSCFNCLEVCPNGSMNFKNSFNRDIKNLEGEDDKLSPMGSISRKKFLTGLAALPVAVVPLYGKEKRRLFYIDKEKLYKFNRKNIATPPGSGNRESFNERCTSCSLCIAECPTGVLQPSVLQYGMSGIMQPFMDYSTGYCNYDCTICGEACPTGAIGKLELDSKRVTAVGKVVFIKENCITFRQGTVCGACSEHCPTKAVFMIPFRDGLVLPDTNTDICIGCGACENVCPVRPYKAIYVEGELVHGRAGKPERKEVKSEKKEGFHF